MSHTLVLRRVSGPFCLRPAARPHFQGRAFAGSRVEVRENRQGAGKETVVLKAGRRVLPTQVLEERQPYTRVLAGRLQLGQAKETILRGSPVVRKLDSSWSEYLGSPVSLTQSGFAFRAAYFFRRYNLEP